MGHTKPTSRYVSKAEQETLNARSIKAKLASMATKKHINDFLIGMLIGAVLFSPFWLKLLGFIND